jgi:hypothetical protein
MHPFRRIAFCVECLLEVRLSVWLYDLKTPRTAERIITKSDVIEFCENSWSLFSSCFDKTILTIILYESYLLFCAHAQSLPRFVHVCARKGELDFVSFKLRESKTETDAPWSLWFPPILSSALKSTVIGNLHIYCSAVAGVCGRGDALQRGGFFFVGEGRRSRCYGRTAALRLIVATLWWRWLVIFGFTSNGAPVEWNWRGKTEEIPFVCNKSLHTHQKETYAQKGCTA